MSLMSRMHRAIFLANSRTRRCREALSLSADAERVIVNQRLLSPIAYFINFCNETLIVSLHNSSCSRRACNRVTARSRFFAIGLLRALCHLSSFSFLSFVLPPPPAPPPPSDHHPARLSRITKARYARQVATVRGTSNVRQYVIVNTTHNAPPDDLCVFVPYSNPVCT